MSLIRSAKSNESQAGPYDLRD